MTLPSNAIAANALPVLSNVTNADSLMLVPAEGGGPGLLTIAGLGGVLGSSDTIRKTVYIGSVLAGFANLANPAACSQLLGAGNVGLYCHANGMAALTPQQRSQLWATWGITGVTATGQGQTVAEVGDFSPVSPGYAAFFGGQYPDECNMNAITGSGDGAGTYTAGPQDAKPGTQYTGYITANDLATVTAAIQAAITAGTKNVAVYLTPNGGGEDLDDSFATGSFWANARAIVNFGGGLGLDVPPSYWVARGPAYQSFVAGQILWAKAAGWRTSLTVSPYALTADANGNTGGQGYDPNFLVNTKLLVTALKRAGALPSQWIVENYGAGGTGNDISATDGAPGSLNEVALWLARTVPAADAGTGRAGANGVTEASLMSSTRTGTPTLLSSVAGAGLMASQDNDQVSITGGSINGAVSITTTEIANFFGNLIVQGTNTAIVLDGNEANQLVAYRPDSGALSIVAPGFIADQTNYLSGSAASIVAVPLPGGSAYEVRPSQTGAPVWQVNAAGQMEIGSTTAAQNTYLDLHCTGVNNDYDARIMATGGTGSGSGTAELAIYAQVLLLGNTFLNAQWPTSAAGLAPGSVWCDTANGKTLKVV